MGGGGETKLFVAPVFCRSHVPSWQSAVPALRGGGPAVAPSAGFEPRVAARVRLCGAVRAVRGCARCALEGPRGRCWCARGRVFNLLKLCRNVILGVSRRSLLVRDSWLSMQSEMQMSFCQAVS